MNHDLAAAGPNSRQRHLALLGLYASIFAFSISFGGLVPWMALDMEARGIDAAIIGLVGAAHPLGVLLMSPFTQGIVRRFGSGNAMVWCTLIAVVTLLPMPVFDAVWVWLILRFISGLAGSVPWVVTETWINVASNDRNRGRAVALYAAIMAAGFAAGPTTLNFALKHGVSPMPIFIGLQVISLLIVVWLRRLAPSLAEGSHGSLRSVFVILPALLSAAFLSGALDATFFSFLHIWGQRIGFEEGFALQLLSIFIAGNILLQFPLGWLADRWGPYPVLLGCGLACIIVPIVILLGLPGVPILLAAVTFVWGGFVWGAYSVALVAMGRRYTGGRLVMINAAFVMVYTFSNVVGPPSGGAAIDLWGPDGLMVVALVVAVVFTILVALRRKEF
jgi:MFS family permease